MDNKTIKVLYEREEIQDRVEEIAQKINREYSRDEDLIIICLLKGGFIFTSDLVRYMKRNVQIEFMVVSSYGDSEESSGSVNVKLDIDCSIQDKDVIIVDDIVDTGNTLHAIKELLQERSPRTLKTCCLLDKEERRVKDVNVDYCVLKCPNKFVIGYGMDAASKFRNLPYVGYIEQ